MFVFIYCINTLITIDLGTLTFYQENARENDSNNL